ncbi:MAG: hypothetical protein ACN4GM_05385 [Gammaproteobacteria bacterium]
MKIFNILILVLAPMLLVNAAIAGPAQRLIIQFDTSLSAEQKQALNQQMQLIIKTDYRLLPHSTDRRWIIVVDPALNKEDLNKVIEAMIRLEHVEYVEPDQILKVFH